MAARAARTGRARLAHPGRAQLHHHARRLPGVRPPAGMVPAEQPDYAWPSVVRGEAPMTTGPQDEPAPAGRGRLRASHADREQAIELLKAAFVQDRLDKDEFDARVGQAFVSRTYAELAAVTADIPA